MASRKPIRSEQLTTQMVEILIEKINDGTYPPNCKLPSENDLAEEFNVSRTTIRGAMGILAGRGLIIRRHGNGTFVNKLSRVPNLLNDAYDFNYLIKLYGFTPSVQYIQVEVIQAGQELGDSLSIKPVDFVLESYKVFLADENPMVYVINYVPLRVLGEDLAQELVENPDKIEPLYDLLEQQCNQRTEYHLTKLRADLAKNCKFPNFPHHSEDPIVVMEEIGLNSESSPLWYSIEYFIDEISSFEMIRFRRPNINQIL